MAAGADSLDGIDDALFAQLAAIVRDAGVLTTQHFRRGERLRATISWKEGNSPVTEVDFAVDNLLRERLLALLPHAGWLSEETADTSERLAKNIVFVVDPIDGTRAFMEGDPRFAVSVAIVVEGRPVAAIVDAPALGQVFSARAGSGAYLNGQRLSVSSHDVPAGARLVGPKFLIDPVAQKLGMVPQPKMPSLALRLAQVADDTFDVAIASTDSHDWDIAGADLILAEAGASLRNLDGTPPVYNRPETKHGILVAAAEPLHAPLRSALLDVTAAWRDKGKRG